MRTQNIRLMAFVTLILLSPFSAAALNRGRQALITDPGAAETMMKTVENAVWAADGEAWDKQVYVVYSTECAWSKKLHADTRALTGRVQLRWIAAEANGADYVVSGRNAAAVKDAFDGHPGNVADPAFGARAVALNLAAMNSLSQQLKPYGGSQSFSYPTLIYRADKGVRVISGNPADYERLAQEVANRPEKSQLQPAGIRIAGTAYRTLPAPRLKEYLNNGKTPVPVYAFPDRDAPVFSQLEPTYVLTAVGVVEGEQWVEVAPWGNTGLKAYVHAPLEARLARLNYTVKPAQGQLSSTHKALEIRSHPVADAPLLDTMPQGYQVRKTGEVEINGTVWDEVLPFTDDTRGYVER